VAIKWSVLWSAAAGKLIVFLLLCLAASLGFGTDWWVSTMTGWLADPLGLSLTVVRLLAVLLLIACFGILLWQPVWDRLRPKKFSLSFDKDRDIHWNLTLFEMATGKEIPNKANFVHVRVAASKSGVPKCKGWIVKLERLNDEKKVLATLEETRPLLWAPREHGILEMDIAPNTAQDIDVFRTVETVNKLELLSLGHSRNWVTFFDAPGLYRITVSISGDMQTRAIELMVTWRGISGNFDVE
jgi:hypothetical protein